MTAGTRRNGGGARVRILVVGQTGHGKSALIARLVGDVGGLPGWDRGEASEATQIPFDTAKRGYLVTDTSGHREFVGSMVTGELAADGAILVVDVDQSVLHAIHLRRYRHQIVRVAAVRQPPRCHDGAGMGKPIVSSPVPRHTVLQRTQQEHTTVFPHRAAPRLYRLLSGRGAHTGGHAN